MAHTGNEPATVAFLAPHSKPLSSSQSSYCLPLVLQDLDSREESISAHKDTTVSMREGEALLPQDQRATTPRTNVGTDHAHLRAIPGEMV